MEHYRVVEAKRGDAAGSVNGQSLNYAYLLQEEGYRSTGCLCRALWLGRECSYTVSVGQSVEHVKGNLSSGCIAEVYQSIATVLTEDFRYKSTR